MFVRPLTDHSVLRGAVTWSAAYDYSHDRYQAYYGAGLSQAVRELGASWSLRHLQRWPTILRTLRWVRSSYRLAQVLGPRCLSGFDTAAKLIGGRALPRSGVFHPLVGQYEFAFDGGRVARLVIDAQDSGALALPDLAAAADIYVKTNYHSGLSYPANVLPECNGNPLILPHLPTLRRLRWLPPEYDVCCVVRVWGGKDEVEGVEHNLRLLEAVNRANVRKLILAYLVTGDIDQQESRLRKQGIPTTRTPIPLRRLWNLSAVSRINIIRLGMHNCIPWRFMDMLAMGASVVFDQRPQTTWAPPLQPDRHYLDLGLTVQAGRGVADDRAYAEVPRFLEELVRNPSRAVALGHEAAAYFDTYAQPIAVGWRLIAHLTQRIS